MRVAEATCPITRLPLLTLTILCSQTYDIVCPRGCASFINQIRSINSVNVVLLPVQRGVGLNDDVLVCGLLEFVDEHGLASLERFSDFRMHAQSKIRGIRVGSSHLARCVLDFVTQRRSEFPRAGAGARRARLAQHTFERLLGAFARDADEAEFVERERLRRSFILV